MKISIKAARVNAELTQRQAAAEIGVDPSTLVAWESGKRKIPVNQFAKLCALYGVDFADIERAER